MDKPFEYVKSLVLYYKLETCCCVAPIRIGLIFTGYFSAFMAVLCIEATANESFPPTIVKVQEMLLEDNATKSIPILAYCTELGFSFLLLCGIYRSDLVLLRIYMYYCIAAIIMSLLVYSIVIAAIDVLIQIAIILSTAFQFYVLLLVRSAMVEIKLSRKNGNLPTLVMSSLLQKEEIKTDVEAPKEENEETPDTKNIVDAKKVPEIKKVSETKNEPVTKIEPEIKKVPDIKVETVKEKPKEDIKKESKDSKGVIIKLNPDK